MPVRPLISELLAARSADPPSPPDGLGPAGVELWRRIGAYSGVSPDRGRAALDACALADRVAELDAAVGRDGAMIQGSKGQPVPHPAIGEARQHRQTIAGLLGLATS